MAVPKYLKPESSSLEDFVFFLVRTIAAVLILVALGRWALTADVSVATAPAVAGVVAGGAGVVARWVLARSGQTGSEDRQR